MNECDSEVQILIRLLRAPFDWSQAELAEAAGLDPSSVHRYERGQVVVAEETMEQLARAAGVSPAFLHGSMRPFVTALRAEIAGQDRAPGKVAEEVAQSVGVRVGALARDEALRFLSSLAPSKK